MKINILLTLAIFNTLSIQADMNLEENMYAPARQMKMLDDAMERGIQEQHQKNLDNPIVFKDDKAFHEAPMVNLVEHDNSYTLEQNIEDAKSTKVKVSVSGNELRISTETKTKDSMNSGNSSHSSSYTSTTTQTISIPMDGNGNEMQHSYENGILKVTIPKRAKFKH